MTSVREERRLVTCMFVDVVGSTELTMRFGAERLKRELGVAFSELSAIITSYGGTVEKYVGDAIYALFGAPITHEDDSLRALRAGVALRTWCLRGAAHGHPFAVRIGIETGEAIVDLDAATTTRQQMSVGPVVNIAARLQQRAEPGEILVGPTAREATNGLVELDALGEADLKGIGRLSVWRLVDVGARITAPPLFVGREAELNLLGLAYQRAAHGRSVLAIVSGPPGQGKTRLVQQFLGSRADGSRVIVTRCRPADEVGVFAPMRELLGVTTLDALTDRVGRLCSTDVECERLVAGLAESAGIATTTSLGRLPAAERDDEIVQAWRRYLEIIGTDQLIVLAIDDIHWADTSLVRLVDRLTSGGSRLLVVATARPEFAESAGIRPTGDRFFIELEGLEEDEARRLAAETGARDDRSVERAEGNPLFIVELARSRNDPAALPLTLQGALGARLDELTPAERALLSHAAVAGERFNADDAAFLGQREVAETSRALGHLADLHFLALTRSGYRFQHGLVREVAYGRLLTADRMRAHARFAQARVHVGDVERLAYHWWAALSGSDAEWVWADDPDAAAMRREGHRVHIAAGKRHAEHFAIAQAVELLERALALATEGGERAAAEHALGTAYRKVLRQDEAWEHLTRARELFRAGGVVPLDLYADLVDSAQFVGAFHRPPNEDEIAQLADEGASVARASGDLRTLSRILQSRGAYLVNSREEEPERAEPFVDAAVAAAEASGDPEVRGAALRMKASVLRVQGRFDEASPVLDEVEHLLAADPFARLSYVRARAMEAWARGDLVGLEDRAREAVEMAEAMGPHNRTHAWGNLSDALLARGKWDEVIELAHRTARLVIEERASAFCRSAAVILRDGAVARALRGERDEALALIRAMPTNDVEVDLVAAVPRALLGFASPETDAKLAAQRWPWWEWLDAAFRAVILGRPDQADRALAAMGRIATDSVLGRAFAESVREAISELRGGPSAQYASLRRIGFTGWVDILRRRVDAEY